MIENYLEINDKDVKINVVNLSQLVFEVTDASQWESTDKLYCYENICSNTYRVFICFWL